MTQIRRYSISLRDTDAIEPFVQEYILEAIERINSYDECEYVTFAPSRDPETGEQSNITFGFAGEPDTIFEKEEPRLSTHRESGLIEDWEQSVEMSFEEMADITGTQTAELGRTVSGATTEMAKMVYETFDELPEAVDTYPDEPSPEPFGWWAVIHTLTVQANYSLEEELLAYKFGTEHTLRNIAEYESEQAAEDRLDELITSLEEMRDRVKEGRPEPE